MGAHKTNPTAQFFQNRPPALDLDKCESYKCSKCNNEEFFTIFILKKISILYTQSGKEELMPVEFFKCAGCGEITKIIKGPNARR